MSPFQESFGRRVCSNQGGTAFNTHWEDRIKDSAERVLTNSGGAEVLPELLPAH